MHLFGNKKFIEEWKSISNRERERDMALENIRTSPKHRLIQPMKAKHRYHCSKCHSWKMRFKFDFNKKPNRWRRALLNITRQEHSWMWFFNLRSPTTKTVFAFIPIGFAVASVACNACSCVFHYYLLSTIFFFLSVSIYPCLFLIFFAFHINWE